MRILLTTDTVGGVWDYTLELTRELRGRGDAVLLAVVGEADGERLAQLPPGVEVEGRAYRLEWMPDAAADVDATGEWLGGLARRWGAEVAHLNQLAYAAHDFGAPTVVVIHSDVLSWFSETHGVDAPAEWSAYAEGVGRGIRSADLLVAPSSYQSELARRHYGRAADRVIHNGVQPPAEAPARRAAPLVLSVGRAWDEAKGMRVLDAAAGRLGPRAPAIEVLGELCGPHGQRFIATHLRCRGRATRDEVSAWMRRASLYVGASLYEPFGLAPLEAALHGCALVLSDIPSFRELWDGCAVFFPKGDAPALAELLAGLAPDLDRCAALAEAARARALQSYTAARFAREYLGLYRRVAREGAGNREQGWPRRSSQMCGLD